MTITGDNASGDANDPGLRVSDPVCREEQIEVPETGSLLAAGPRRDKIAAQLGKKYDGGMSMRALADEYGRSYGFIHKLVWESGVMIRGRGGDNRRSADSS